MMHEIFLEYILPIGTLVLLEGLLSADNALVLAILVKHLPKEQRKKALLYGLVGAFVLRGIGILAATWIIKLWYLQGIGALYLAYLTVAHFIRHHRTKDVHGLKKKPDFWHTVIIVEFTDLAFAIDSILVAVALTNNIWVIYTGGMLGIIAMRIAAGAFLKILDRFPDLEHMAYALVGWIAVKLSIQTWESFSNSVLNKTIEGHILHPWIFWTVMALIIILGCIYSYRKQKPLGSGIVKELEDNE
jgi:YkoY family integral membrane protein